MKTMRLQPSSPDPNQPKKAKPDSIDEEHLARFFFTPEDRNLPPDEFWSKRTDGFIEAMMEKIPKSCAGLEKKLPETLPEGCTWGYDVPGSGLRSYVVKMFCLYCGAAHLEEDCPKKDTQGAKPIFNFPIFRPKTK
ncbi:PREDICTED: uncharacterized protein LOC101291726 [Fragaria vesca subsp. vesca]|uniref:uncharacterized protein LOC101291726 n=1 Tax=Fragaria vesca subsp. vesca TaxID=101020 RepID=UPI0002C3706B|nr:PREDICTED: uncharacterized protein LOC101291726 [Fragaria vesca subsp. vesca]